jgi:hypothetical protein
MPHCTPLATLLMRDTLGGGGGSKNVTFLPVQTFSMLLGCKIFLIGQDYDSQNTYLVIYLIF